MAEISRSENLEASSDKIWALIKDFGNLQGWWPADLQGMMPRVECEGSGVGMVRNIYSQGASDCVSEKLDYLDEDTKTIQLSIVGNLPAGLTSYVATGKVTEIDSKSCRFDYFGKLAAEPGREQEAEQFIRMAWSVLFKGLRAVGK